MDEDVNIVSNAGDHLKTNATSDSTISETFCLLTMPCFVLFFLEMLINVFVVHKNLDNWKTSIKFPIEFTLEHFILITPVLLTSTIYSDSVASAYVTIVLVCFCLLLWNVLENPNKATLNDLLLLPVSNQQVFITYLRSIVLVFSGMVILAVDFKFFPHKFTKSETVGYSVMDAGVGLFIVSNAIVSKFPNYEQNFVKVIKNTIPLIVLGVGRYFILNLINYHTNEKEYGSHWNFFITLAVVKLMSYIIFKLSDHKAQKVLWISIILLFIHQYLLNSGVRDWVFRETERNNFIDANKEGIVSSLGFEILYLFGVLLKLYFPQKDQAYSIIDMLSTLFPAAIIFLMFHLYSDGLDPISRRVINASYIFWVLVLACFMLLFCLVIEICNKILFNKDLNEKFRVSLLLDAVNYNSLFYFLICNLLTGFVNMSINTLGVSEVNSFLIVFFYMFLVNMIVSILYLKNIKLKI